MTIRAIRACADLFKFCNWICSKYFLQVDGSSDSLGGFQAQFTMRECEEQISGLKKENFNLKLRIYFMEQSQGQVHGAKDQVTDYLGICFKT